MPDLILTKIVGHLTFSSHRLELPSGWKPPIDRAQYQNALSPAERHASARLLPAWFFPVESHKYFQDACDRVGRQFMECHDTILDAIGYAHSLWRLEAKFQNLTLLAVAATGGPGCLDGPALEERIKSYPGCAGWTGHLAKYRDAAAAGVSQCFKRWQDQVTVPGLPWYPAFAAFPGPMAPPLPNVPMPLVTCASVAVAEIVTPAPLKAAMIDAFDTRLKQEDRDRQHEALFDALATVLALGFVTWLPSQQVMQVLGQGPVPSFAPPFSPVGPVMGGQTLALPGHLLS